MQHTRIRPPRRGTLPWLALVVVGAGLAGCVSVDRAGVEAFLRGDLEGARALFREAAARKGRDVALHLDNLGVASMLAGDLQDATQAFLAAGRVFGNFETPVGEEIGAVLLSEDTKTYRGDPYEKSMNSFYAGLLYFLRGEYDTALAGFEGAALADSGRFPGVEGVDDPQAGQAYECDNALVLAMEGTCHRILGEAGNARQVIQAAERSLEARGIDSGFLASLPWGAGSSVFLVEIGLAPRKVPDGRYGSAVRFVPAEFPEASAEILVDGRTLGRAALIEDLYYQASTQGGREMDAILAGKAVFKDLAIQGGAFALAQGNAHGSRGFALAGLFAMLAGFSIRPEADVRHWETLPGRVLMLAARVEPGVHDVTVRFLDPSGARIPDLEQQWRSVRFAGDRENLLLLRAGFGPAQGARPPGIGGGDAHEWRETT